MTSVWRLGNRNPNNLYFGEDHVGMLIDPERAKAIVAAMNGDHSLQDCLAQATARCPEGWKVEAYTEPIERADREPKAEDWGACCDHRALQLHRLREEREAGMVDAAELIAAALRDRGLRDEVRFVAEYAEGGFQRPQGASEPVDPHSPPQ